jgi:hypothetical protein
MEKENRKAGGRNKQDGTNKGMEKLLILPGQTRKKRMNKTD